jgi:hypothetical protein
MFTPDVHRALVSDHRAALVEIARQERLAAHPTRVASVRARAGFALVRVGVRLARVPTDVFDGCAPSPTV